MKRRRPAGTNDSMGGSGDPAQIFLERFDIRPGGEKVTIEYRRHGPTVIIIDDLSPIGKEALRHDRGQSPASSNERNSSLLSQ